MATLLATPKPGERRRVPRGHGVWPFLVAGPSRRNVIPTEPSVALAKEGEWRNLAVGRCLREVPPEARTEARSLDSVPASAFVPARRDYGGRGAGTPLGMTTYLVGGVYALPLFAATPWPCVETICMCTRNRVDMPPTGLMHNPGHAAGKRSGPATSRTSVRPVSVHPPGEVLPR
jgi:hypothetical protein